MEWFQDDLYLLLISPDGTELLIGAGDRGICLPFMSQSTTACVLTQTAGKGVVQYAFRRLHSGGFHDKV